MKSTNAASTHPHRSVWLVFTSWKMATMLLLGFSSGLPLALTATGATVQAWLKESGMSLTMIGLFAAVGTPYSLKFLWAPFMDRYAPNLWLPFANQRLGRRRAWLLLTQILLLVTILAMGMSKPGDSPTTVILLGTLIAFFSASQDIVADAYRAEALEQKEYGAGAGVFVMGYRIAMIVSGAIALILADQMPWSMVFFLMAMTMGIGIVATALAPEPEFSRSAPKSLRDSIVMPLVDFIRRPRSGEVMAFLVLYKLDTALTLALSTAFFLSLGFTKTEVGAVNKVFGMIAVIAGTLAGGAAMIRIGMQKSLWVFGLAQALAGLSFMMLAHFGRNYALMVMAVTAENFFSGMGNAAFTAFMMSLCNKSFTATQYALISSLMALTRNLASAPSGWMASSWGYEYYYLACTLAGIPGLILLTRYRKWAMPAE